MCVAVTFYRWMGGLMVRCHWSERCIHFMEGKKGTVKSHWNIVEENISCVGGEMIKGGVFLVIGWVVCGM